jgi:hypothetical protein
MHLPVYGTHIPGIPGQPGFQFWPSLVCTKIPLWILLCSDVTGPITPVLGSSKPFSGVSIGLLDGIFGSPGADM